MVYSLVYSRNLYDRMRLRRTLALMAVGTPQYCRPCESEIVRRRTGRTP
jgi:hypothetical protein